MPPQRLTHRARVHRTLEQARDRQLAPAPRGAMNAVVPWPPVRQVLWSGMFCRLTGFVVTRRNTSTADSSVRGHGTLVVGPRIRLDAARPAGLGMAHRWQPSSKVPRQPTVSHSNLAATSAHCPCPLAGCAATVAAYPRWHVRCGADTHDCAVPRRHRHRDHR